MLNELKVEEYKIGILGLGYVGLTLSTIMADIGFRVVGIDRDSKLISDLKNFKPHFHEKGLQQMLVSVSKKDNPPKYQVGLKDSLADIYIITVGTPIIRPSLEPNLDYVRSAAEEVANVLKKGDMVILRSTVPVNTTRNVVLPVLEKKNNLKAGKDFDLAFCPERTVEGKALKELRELPQIIGGLNSQSALRAQNLFQKITPATITLESIESSEMLKIMDNTYRDMIFAYSNQIALVCNANNLNMVPIVNAANQGYNRNNIPLPSPGVGGACLSKDPYILASVCNKSGSDPSLFLKGRSINEYMPIHTSHLVINELKKLKKDLNKCNVSVLGFAFKGKPETSDMRDSPSIDLVNELQKNLVNVSGHDPLVRTSEIEALGVKLTNIEKSFINSDAVIIMINHPMYSDIDIIDLISRRNNPIVFMDSWNLYQRGEFSEEQNIIHLHI